MKLRRHRKLSSKWPPAWDGSYQTSDKFPMGENGVTFKSATLMKDHVQVSVYFDGKDYTGRIDSRDPDFLKRVYEVLLTHGGKSFKNIGDLDIDSN